MKTRDSVSIVALFIFGLVFSLQAVLAQAPPTPGPEHEVLKKFEGTWTSKGKVGEEETTGTMTYKMELGGLWLASRYEGSMFGQKFEGRGMDTYDANTQKYVSVWVDSMTSRPMILEGTYDKAKKTLIMKGQPPNPGDKPFKMVTQFKNDDHHTFTMYVVNDDGTEEKVMTMEYTRKK